MRNAVLHLISNKSGDFNSSLFPENSFYTPQVTTPEEDFIRTKLFINDSNYHLVNSMLAVYAFPEILMEFRESATTYDFKDLQQNIVTITGANYANTSTENFNIVNIPDKFPTPNYFNWQVKYQDSGHAVFSGCDSSISIPCSLTSTTQGSTAYNILTADWPAQAGIKGGFALDTNTSWSYGTSFSLYVYPAVFPYEAAIAYINKFSEVSTVLNNTGLSRNYYNAQSAIEKYATLMLAIANPAVKNPATTSSCK